METVNIELDGQIYKINIAKLICEINELDKAWQSVANRRMKKGKYDKVLQVLYVCKTGHDVDIEDVTPGMLATVANELV